MNRSAQRGCIQAGAFRRDCGVTLIEMLVVTTLIGLLAAVVTPSVASGLDTLRLRNAGERLAATFKLAHDRAVRTRHYLQVSLDPETRQVELKDLEGDFARNWELPETIQMKAGRRVAFQFAPDGGTPVIKVALENAKRRTLEVGMDPFTAFPTMKEQ